MAPEAGWSPGEQRYAVIPPYAAQWLLQRLIIGLPTNPATVHNEARRLAKSAHPLGRVYGGQVLGAWRQLESSAVEHRQWPASSLFDGVDRGAVTPLRVSPARVLPVVGHHRPRDRDEG